MFGRNKEKNKKPLLKKHKKLKLGLALGGGGARGIAHIGVLRAFEELGIDFDYIAGTSAGSVVGALYTAGFSSLQIRDIALSLKTKDIRTSKIFFKPSKASAIASILIKAFGHDKTFKELYKPLCVVAVDIKTGEEKDLTNGSVATCVSGSCAVPGVFAPVQYENMNLVDGGLKNNVPANVVRKMGADVVVAVDVNHARGRGTKSTRLFSVLGSTIGVLMNDTVKTKLKYADIVLEPELTKFPSTKLENIDEMIEIGYRAVMENLGEMAPIFRHKITQRKKKEWQRKLTSEEI